MADSNFKVRYGLDVAGDATLTGDLTVQGNDIKSSTGTPITLSGNDVTVTGDLAVNGGDITTNQTTFNLLNSTATTLNIGGGATTAVNIGNAAGEIDTPSDIQIIGTKSIRQGSGPYSASTDIFRDNGGTAADGILISNNNFTNANSVIVNQVFGQTTNGGGTTTAIPASVVLQGSRGTAASALPTNSGNELGLLQTQANYGTTAATGIVFGNDLYAQNGSAAGIITTATQNFRQTAQATLTGSISGTTLTVTAVASGTITPGHEIRGTGFAAANAGYVITRQLTTTAAANALGSTGTYELNVSPGTIGSSTMNTFSITGGTSTRIYNQPSNAAGAGAGQWPASPNTTIGLTMSGGSLTGNFQSVLLQPNWSSYPVLDRIVTSITGGNTLVIAGTPIFSSGFYNGATVSIITAGDPNGLVTSTTYFIDTNPSPGQITLRTNSVSGGAVTGLTNGTGLFIRIQVRSQGLQGLNPNNSFIQLHGARAGYNYNSLNPVYDFTRQNDFLGAVQFLGSNASGFTGATNAIRFQATEDWTASNAGSQFNITAVKTAAGGTFTTNIGPNTTNFRTDAFNVINTSGTTNLAVATGGLVTVQGNLQVNGNNIRASDGSNNITMTSNTLTTVQGSLQVNGNIIRTSGGNTVMSFDSAAANARLNGIVTFGRTANLGSLYESTLTPGGAATGSILKLNSASTGGTLTSDISFANYRFNGTTLSATQNNDLIGGFKFIGNTATSGSVPTEVIGVGFNATATENWTPTANGTKFSLSARKNGTTTSGIVIDGSPTSTVFSSDQITFKDFAGTNLTSAAITYTRTYGEFAYTAGTITIAAQNTVYAFPLDTTLNASGVTISNTSRVNVNVAGWYKIIMSLQCAMETNSIGQFDFWLRKNGVDVANSATQVDLLKDQKAVVAMDWLVESDGNDYWEIMYASPDADYADIDFPYIAAWTTPGNAYDRPAAPPILVNVIPAGM